jgi:peptidoglycan hydrolase-like protein with peptidoglycan-binding domain
VNVNTGDYVITFTPASQGRVTGYFRSSSPLLSLDATACTASTNFSPITGARCLSSSAQSSTIQFTTNLSYGTRSAAVTVLQQYLNTHGFPIALTGPGSLTNETIYFGPATKMALIKFQKMHTVPATGFFGPLSRRLMNGR